MKKFFVLTLVLIAVNSVKAEVSFQGLGDLPGRSFKSAAKAISGNGLVVVEWSESTSGLGRSFSMDRQWWYGRPW